MSKTDWHDIGFKVWWTAVAAGLGVLVTVAGDLPAAWAPVLTAVANAALAYVRQQLNHLAATT